MRAEKQHNDGGFSLVELLVVIGIIAVLMAILLPALAGVREAGKKAACLSNLRQMGEAIHAYANENENTIPFGPVAPPLASPANFYPCTGSPTSLISLLSGEPVGQGLLLKDYLSKQPKVLFCPGSDQLIDADAELAKVGIGQAQGSYYYRHGSSPSSVPITDISLLVGHIRIDKLGENRNGTPIRALAMDTVFECAPGLAAFNVRPRTAHQEKFANIVFSDGHAVSQPNINERYTVKLNDLPALLNAFDRILTAMENADETP